MNRVVNKDISKRISNTVSVFPGTTWLSKVSIKIRTLMNHGSYHCSEIRRHPPTLPEMTHYCVYNSMLPIPYRIPLKFEFQKGDFSRCQPSARETGDFAHPELNGGHSLPSQVFHNCLLKNCPYCIIPDSPCRKGFHFNSTPDSKFFHTNKNPRRNWRARHSGGNGQRPTIDSPAWPSCEVNSTTPSWPEKFVNFPKKSKSALNNSNKCVTAFLDRARDNIKANSDLMIDPTKYLGSIRKNSNSSSKQMTAKEKVLRRIPAECDVKPEEQVTPYGRKRVFFPNKVGSTHPDANSSKNIPWTYDGQCQGFIGTPHKKFQKIIPPKENTENLMMSEKRKYPQKNKKFRTMGKKNQDPNRQFPHNVIPSGKVFGEELNCIEAELMGKGEADFQVEDPSLTVTDSTDLVSKLFRPSSKVKESNVVFESINQTSSAEVIAKMIGAQKSGPTLKDGIPVYFESSVTRVPSKEKIAPGITENKTLQTTGPEATKGAPEKKTETPSKAICLDQVQPQTDGAMIGDTKQTDIADKNLVGSVIEMDNHIKLDAKNKDKVNVCHSQILQGGYMSETTITKAKKPSVTEEIQCGSLDGNTPFDNGMNTLLEVFGSSETSHESCAKIVMSNTNAIVTPIQSNHPEFGKEEGLRIVIHSCKSNSVRNFPSTISVMTPQSNSNLNITNSSSDNPVLQLDPKNSHITLNLQDQKTNSKVVSINSSNRNIKINISSPDVHYNPYLTHYKNNIQPYLYKKKEPIIPSVPKSFADLKSAMAVLELSKSQNKLPTSKEPSAQTTLTERVISNSSLEEIAESESKYSFTPKFPKRPFTKVVKIAPRTDSEYKYYQKMGDKPKENLKPNIEKPLSQILYNITKSNSDNYENRKSSNILDQLRRNFVTRQLYPSRQDREKMSSPSTPIVLTSSKSTSKSDIQVNTHIIKPNNGQLTQSRKRKLYPEEKKLFSHPDPVHSKSKNKKRAKISTSSTSLLRDKVECNLVKPAVSNTISNMPAISNINGGKNNNKVPNFMIKNKEYDKLKQNKSSTALNLPSIDTLKPRQFSSLPYSMRNTSAAALLSKSMNSCLDQSMAVVTNEVKRLFSQKAVKQNYYGERKPKIPQYGKPRAKVTPKPSTASESVQSAEPMMVQASESVTVEVRVPVKEKVREPVKVEVREPVKEKVREPVKVEVREPVKEEVREPVKVQASEPAKVQENFPPQTYEILCSQYKKNEKINEARALLLNRKRIQETVNMMNSMKQNDHPESSGNFINALKPKINKLLGNMKDKLQWQQVFKSSKNTYESLKNELSRLPTILDLKAGRKVGDSSNLVEKSHTNRSTETEAVESYTTRANPRPTSKFHSQSNFECTSRKADQSTSEMKLSTNESIHYQYHRRKK